MTSGKNKMDRIKVEKEWRSRGYSCGLWMDPPGQVWKDFKHETEELVMVVEGEIEIEIEGRLHRPKPGVELVIPAGARHTVRNIGRITARWLYGYKKK